MAAGVERLLEQTVEALSRMDAERLELLVTTAETLPAHSLPRSQAHDAIHVRALQHTLAELLRTTDANLRLLRQLGGLRLLAMNDAGTAEEGLAWVR